jgi:hypothetical protein
VDPLFATQKTKQIVDPLANRLYSNNKWRVAKIHEELPLTNYRWSALLQKMVGNVF